MVPKKKKNNQTPTHLDHSNSTSVADTFPLGNQAESSLLLASWCIYLSEDKSKTSESTEGSPHVCFNFLVCNSLSQEENGVDNGEGGI